MVVYRNDRKLYGEVSLPASKSISNRLLVMQFLYGRQLELEGLSGSDDTILLTSLLGLLRHHEIKGSRELIRMDARNAGTVFRFLTALLAITPGHYFLTGSRRMQERPVKPLVEALKELGADIDYTARPGFPPLIIKGRKLAGGGVAIDGTDSSQFVSALMLIAPGLENGLQIELHGDAASRPYIRMTASLLLQAGARVTADNRLIRVSHHPGVSGRMHVEPDWSAAAFWYAMLSVAEEGEIFFPGLLKSGLQGDQQAAVIFADLGIETLVEQEGLRIRKCPPARNDIHFEFNDCPDLAMPVILATAIRGQQGRFFGLERLALKESDRLAILSGHLSAMGFELEDNGAEGWLLSGKLIKPCRLAIEEAGDHRVAMTFALPAMAGFQVSFEQPEVVNKSYPGFWSDCASMGFSVKG